MARAKPHPLEDFAEAFAIFAKYHTAPIEFQDREWIWGTIEGDVCIDVDSAIVSPDDIARLKELGWLTDEYQSFCFNTHLAYIYDE